MCGEVLKSFLFSSVMRTESENTLNVKKIDDIYSSFIWMLPISFILLMITEQFRVWSLIILIIYSVIKIILF